MTSPAETKEQLPTDEKKEEITTKTEEVKEPPPTISKTKSKPKLEKRNSLTTDDMHSMFTKGDKVSFRHDALNDDPWREGTFHSFDENNSNQVYVTIDHNNGQWEILSVINNSSHLRKTFARFEPQSDGSNNNKSHFSSPLSPTKDDISLAYDEWHNSKLILQNSATELSGHVSDVASDRSEEIEKPKIKKPVKTSSKPAKTPSKPSSRRTQTLSPKHKKATTPNPKDFEKIKDRRKRANTHSQEVNSDKVLQSKTPKTLSKKHGNSKSSLITEDLTARSPSPSDEKETQSERVKPPPQLDKKRVETWNSKEVARWLYHIQNGKFSSYVKRFLAAQITGKKLFQLNRTSLQNEVSVMNPSDRRAILLEIQKLKKRMQEVEKDKVNNLGKRRPKISNSKQEIIPTFRYIYTPFKNTKTEKNLMDITLQSLCNDLVIPESEQSDFKPINDCEILKLGNHLVKIRLKSGEIVYLCTKKLKDWSVSDVVFWIEDVGSQTFVSYANAFEKQEVNGKKLRTATRALLQNELNMLDANHRQFILVEIVNLRVQIDGEKQADAMGLRASVNHMPRSRSMGWADSKKRTPEQIEKERQVKQEFRKLGPRDIGRNTAYTGIQYTPNLSYDFLQDKPFYANSTQAAFEKRKKKNPPEKKLKVQDIGQPDNYQLPEWDNISENASENEESWFSSYRRRHNSEASGERAAGPRETGRADNYQMPQWATNLESLLPTGEYYFWKKKQEQNQQLAGEERKKKKRENSVTSMNNTYELPEWQSKVEKDLEQMNTHQERIVSRTNYEESIANLPRALGPTQIGWNKEFTPPEYKIRDNGSFLEERLFYDSSQVQVEGGWSRLLAKLPQTKLDELMSKPPPTGLHTKIAWLRTLQKLVAAELKEMEMAGYEIDEDGFAVLTKASTFNNKHQRPKEKERRNSANSDNETETTKKSVRFAEVEEKEETNDSNSLSAAARRAHKRTFSRKDLSKIATALSELEDELINKKDDPEESKEPNSPNSDSENDFGDGSDDNNKKEPVE